MPIRACPNCGSDRLAFPAGGSGAYTCWTCKWQGTPTEFPNFAAWQAFRATKAPLPPA